MNTKRFDYCLKRKIKDNYLIYLKDLKEEKLDKVIAELYSSEQIIRVGTKMFIPIMKDLFLCVLSLQVIFGYIMFGQIQKSRLGKIKTFMQ